MSQENVEIVRSTLAAFERARASCRRSPRSMAEGLEAGAPEFEEALGFLDPGIVWNAGDLGSTRGRGQMAALPDDLLEFADACEISLTENGLTAQMDEYLDRRQALEVAGLRE